MPYRSEIERALDEIISEEGGARFQNLAVMNAQQKWPRLIACERKWDGGLDAHANGALEPDGRGIGLASSITGTLEKIRIDARKVREHYPDVQVLIFSTPVVVTKHTEANWISDIGDEFGLQLVVISREEFINWLRTPANSAICRDQLGIAPLMSEDLEPALEHALEAAGEVAENWDRKFCGTARPTISLNAVKLDEKGNPIETTETASLNGILTERQRIILEAPAGSGKTTTLVQLARHALAAGRLAFLVDLPAWIRSGESAIFSHVAKRHPFASRGLDFTLLSKLRPGKPPIFLLNGWNEVSVASAEAADILLRELDRDHGAAVIIVATRLHRIGPQLQDAFRLTLNPLSRHQRNEYLDLTLGASAGRLKARIDESPSLDSITRTPLFLAEITDLFRSGKDIPATKMGVLSAVIDAIEENPDHQTSLQQPPLRGHAAEYLRSLSMVMTQRGETAIALADARPVVSDLSTRLRAAGQIAALPDPEEVLDELSKRHVLVPSSDGHDSFRFQHQQFQEFFAAGGMRARLVNLVNAKQLEQDHAFLETHVNEPRWGESLRMLAEDIGAANGEKAMVEAGAKLVRLALEVDPIFAAEIARRSGPAVWSEVGNEMGVLLRAWYDVGNPYHKRCALAAMLTTGFDDFKDIVVPLLTDPNNQVRSEAYHAANEFLPSSLGVKWKELVQSWTEDARIDLILQLAHDPRLAETVEQLALADPSPRVKWNAARLLSWYGFVEKVERLLAALNDKDFLVAMRSLGSDEIPMPLWPRVIEGYEKLYTEAGDAFERLQILQGLHAFGAKKVPERMRAELDGLKEEQLKGGNERQVTWALREIRKSDPEWVNDWLVRRMLEGSTQFRGLMDLIVRLPAQESESILTRFTTQVLQPNEEQRLLPLLAATADEAVAARVLESACGIRRGLSNPPGQDQSKWNLFRQHVDLLSAIPSRVFLDGVSHKLAKDPEMTELDVLTDALGKFKYTTSNTERLLPDELRHKLHAYLKRATELAVRPESVSASTRAHLAVLLAQIGGPKDLPDLRRLIEADSIRYREVLAARMKGDRSGDSVSYVLLYIAAVERADPEHADDMLLELLSDPQYERFVAEELVRRAGKPEAPRRLESNRLDFEKVWTAREGKDSGEFAEERRRRFADAIRVQVEKLLRERDAATDKRMAEYRLKTLAGPLAALDAQRSATLILEVMGLPGQHDGYTRVASMEGLILAGVRLTLGQIMKVLGPAIEETTRHLYSGDQNRWLMQRYLSVLALANPAAEGIAKIREILSHTRLNLYESERLITALGASRCSEAMELLIELAKPDGSGIAAIGESWIKAVGKLGGQRSDEVLLAFVDPETNLFTTAPLPDHRDGDLLARLLADRAEKNSSFKKELLRLANGDLPPAKRAVLAKTFSRFHGRHDLAAGLCVLRDGSGIPYDLLRSIEEVFLERRPHDAGGNAYTVAPRGSNEVRKRLLEMAATDPNRKHTAYALLGQIEEWRLEHGRPIDEPRHPALESGLHWPLV